ncbi:MAG: aldose 1-epimerase family protein [Bacteroidota bacterium]
MQILENEYLRVQIKDKGAELCSIYDKSDQTEHIWQADPTFWPWHAPMLFPIIGVSENDELRIDGKKYPMAKHGFARHSIFTIKEATVTNCVFSLAFSEETLAIYPYKFELQVCYELVNTKLCISYKISNLDNQMIYFNIGGHPAIAIAYKDNESIEDYAIVFEQAETLSRHHINKADGMFNGESSIVLKDEAIIPITQNMFEKDAYIFKNLKSRSLLISSKNHSKTVKVSFPDFNYLGIWAIPGAKYVCIEPWLGCADTKGQLIDFQHKEGIISLASAAIFNCSYSIQIN